MSEFTTSLRTASGRLDAQRTAVHLLLAACVGCAAGLGAVGFRWLVHAVQVLFFVHGASLLTFMQQYYVIVLPAVGGLVVGVVTHFLAREAAGQDVPEIMDSVAHRGGRVRPLVSIVEAVVSAITIGSGGSAGRVGPVVHVGSSIGSGLGQLFRRPPRTIRLLVACGAAGAVSATFNAPIAGVLFSLEVILGTFEAQDLGVVVVASVFANMVAIPVLGTAPAFSVPHDCAMAHPMELGLYALLGLLAGVVAMGFAHLLYRTEDVLAYPKRLPDWARPVIGGLLVGAMALYSYDVLSLSFDEVPWASRETLDNALFGQLAMRTMFTMAMLKIVATSLSLGSGGSGGVFAPLLVVGGMLGGGFGKAVVALFPGLNTHPSGYAVVGMGAVFAAATRAPMTGAVLVFELTRNYRMMLPLLIAVVIATIVGHWLSGGTIYTLKLVRRYGPSAARDGGAPSGTPDAH